MIGDVRHKSEVDLRSTEERTIMLIDKYFQKIKFGEGGEGVQSLLNGGGSSSLEIDSKMTSIKDELKATLERMINQNNEKQNEVRKQSEMLLEGRC